MSIWTRSEGSRGSVILPSVEMHLSINTWNALIIPLSTHSLSSSSEGPAVNANVSVPLMFRGEDMVELPQEDLPVKLSQVPNPPESRNLASSFPGHIFEPAVLLTPPRQKSNSEFCPLQDGKQASSKAIRQLFFLCFIYVKYCVHFSLINRILKDTDYHT